MIRTEDGVVLDTGSRAFNYYDMKPGRIHIDALSYSDGWFEFVHDDGTTALLNGARICSIEFAQRKGWL